jgi:fluoroquinolone resistance protein
MTLFQDASYENETFSNVQWEDELEDIEFFNCVFTDASFQSSRLTGCSFDSCEFTRCNLSLVEIRNTAFLDVHFRDCKMIGIAWSAVGGFLTAGYERCALNNNIFSDMNLARFTFTSCSLVEASFHNTKLRHANFDDCDLSGCMFSQADLSFADFTTSRNYYVNATENTLHKTRFSLPEAVSLLANLDIVLD